MKLAGVGGHAMAAAGISSPFAINELSIIGLTAIPQRLPKIFRRIRETARAIVAARPDALVIIDSPDFTHRVARRVRRPVAVDSDHRLRLAVGLGLAVRPGARYARLHRSGAGDPAVRARYPCRARRAALQLCRPSADRTPRRAAAQCRGGAASFGRSAAGAGLAGQPLERNPPPCRHFRRDDRARSRRGSERSIS